MRGAHLARRLRRPWTSGRGLLLLGLALLLVGCSGGGDSGSLTPASQPSAPTTDSAPEVNSATLEQQATQNLVELYRTAILQEDSDRLQALLAGDGGAFARSSFLDAMATTFRQFAVTDLELSAVDIQGAPTPMVVTFQEALSVVDPVGLTQRTQVGRTRWQLGRRVGASGVVTMLLAGVAREGPQFEVVMRGRVMAGLPTRVEVRETMGIMAIAGGELEVLETGELQALVPAGNRWHGIITPPAGPALRSLRVRLRGPQGETLELQHRYHLQGLGEGVVQPVLGTAATRFFAVAVAPDGTLWGGGDAGGTLVQVTPGATTASLVGQLLADADGRVEDLVVDALGRLHALVFAPTESGDIVFDQGIPCQTVNVFNPAYPLRVLDLETGALKPSASVRAVAAEGGDLWLHGSDGGVTRVADTFRRGQCPQEGAGVRYDPIFRRGESGLLSNSVPAFRVGADGALWFGTAVGLTRLLGQQFTPVLFDPGLSVQGNVATLEAFFQEVARAIFEARPLTTGALGDISFLQRFGRPVVKEDLIFSLAEDGQGRMWVGTLGGGLRRVDARNGVLQDTLLLTRLDGLSSNLILKLTVGPDGSMWAATEEGVSHIREVGGTLTITSFTALDGLGVPVRDVAVAGDGTVWLGTDRGLFRIAAQGGVVRGVVVDSRGQPVAGAEVVVVGTPFRAVTDAAGRFVLVNLPLGPIRLEVDSSQAAGGPFDSVVRDVSVGVGEQILPPAELPEPGSLVRVSGEGQIGVVGLPLPQPLVVAVREREGQPVPGSLVSFRVLEGAGVVSSATGVTGADGQASTTLTLGQVAGRNVVQARVEGLGAVEFTATGIPSGMADQDMARLIIVSGDRQVGVPGEVLPEPLVVQLEDQFGHPLAGELVTAEIARGEGVLLPDGSASVQSERSVALPSQASAGSTVTVQTDATGQASFFLRAGDSAAENDILVAVSAPALTQVKPVRFLAIVGTIDTPDIPLDLAVSGNLLFVADRRADLQIIDVSDPTNPTPRDQVSLDGIAVRLALAGDRAYVATNFPLRLYILGRDQQGRDQQVLGRAQFPENSQRHGITGLAVQETYAYVTTDARTQVPGTQVPGTLQVVDVSHPSGCSAEVGSTPLSGRPRGIAVSGDFAYVPAGKSGLLIFNISDPTNPEQAPASPLTGTFYSDIALANGFAYVVETVETHQNLVENYFTVLDLRNPSIPQRLGSVRIKMATQVEEVAAAIAVDDRFAYLVQFASGLQAIDIRNPNAPRVAGSVDTPSQALNVTIAGDFLYVSDQIFGVQVIRRPTEAELDPARDGPRDLDPNPLPQGITTIVVNAGADPGGNGTETTPYRSITEGLKAIGLALRENQVPQNERLTLLVWPGTYSPLTTEEIFPLDLSGLSHLTLRSFDPEDPKVVKATVIDAGFTGDIILLESDPDSLLSDTQVSIEGFTLTHGAHGVISRDLAEITLRQNRIEENIFAGISINTNASAGNTIVGNHIQGNGQEGIGLFQTSMTKITHNIVSDNGGVGIFVSIDATAELAHNTIEGNGDDGVLVDDTSIAMIRENTILENGSLDVSAGDCRVIGNGIVMTSNSKAEISANFIAQNRRDGIILQVNSTATVMNNTITAHKMHGIDIQQASDPVMVNGNIISDNKQDGIRVIRTDAKLTITDNLIIQNDLNGIELVDTSIAVIMGNMIKGTRSNLFGIVIRERTNATVTGNVIGDHGQDGIFVSNATVQVTMNTISGNSANGIHIENTSTATIVDNIVRGNGSGSEASGIRIRARVTADLARNTISGNGGEGGLVIIHAEATLENNEICGNMLDGILLQQGSSAMLTDNAVCENAGDGIQIGGEFDLPGNRSFAAIRGGTITQNTGNGVLVRNTSMANIGLEGGVIRVTGNGGAGISVSGDSLAEINSARIMFDDNDGGDIVGPVIDYAP